MGRQVFPEIRAAMARNGDRQEDLARHLGMSVSQVSRRLSGIVEWSDSEIRKVCERYGQPYEKLFEKDVKAVAANS